MDNEQKFWIGMLGITAVSFLVALALMVHRHNHVDELIAKATHPLEMACALSGSAASHSCITLLGRCDADI